MTGALARGLCPVRAVLPNGLVLLAQENPTAPAVAINASFDAGSLHDPLDLPGVAYLTGKTIDRGTAYRPAEAIAELLDDRGVALRVSVSRHSFTVSCVCLVDDFDALLALIAEIVRRPVFPPDEIEKRRVDAITSIRQDDDNTAVRAGDAVLAMLFGAEHPCGRSPKGTTGALRTIGRSELLAFHANCLVPSALRVAVAGDISPDAVVELGTRIFQDWRGPEYSLPVVAPPPRPRRRIWSIPMPGKSQADIAYGFTTVRRLDPRYYAFWLMNNVLGQFGLGGRLADNIRERQGMAYYAYSTLEATVAEGPMVIRAGVDPDNMERTIEAIDAEVSALCASGPTPEEFADSQESLIGSIPRLLETNEGIAEFLQTAEYFGLGLDYDRQLPQLLRDVTIHQVREAAREALHPGRAAIAIAGPGRVGFVGEHA